MTAAELINYLGQLDPDIPVFWNDEHAFSSGAEPEDYATLAYLFELEPPA